MGFDDDDTEIVRAMVQHHLLLALPRQLQDQPKQIQLWSEPALALQAGSICSKPLGCWPNAFP
jgi:hypothetical protein